MSAVETLIQNLNELKRFMEKLSKLVSNTDNNHLSLFEKINQRVNDMSENCEQLHSEFNRLKRRNKTFHSYLIELACLLLQGNDVLSQVDPIKGCYKGNTCKLVETQEKYYHLKKRLKNFELNVKSIKNILSTSDNHTSQKLTEKEIVKQMDLHNINMTTSLLESDKGNTSSSSSDSRIDESTETIITQINTKNESTLKVDDFINSKLQSNPTTTHMSAKSKIDSQQKNDGVNEVVLKREKFLPLENVQKKTTNGFDFNDSFRAIEKDTISSNSFKKFKLDTSNKLIKKSEPKKSDRQKFKQSVLTFFKKTEAKEIPKSIANNDGQKLPRTIKINNEKVMVVDSSDSDSSDYIESTINKIEERNEDFKQPFDPTPPKKLEIDLDETYVSSPILKKYSMNNMQTIKKEKSPPKEFPKEKSPVYDFVSPEFRKGSKKTKAERMNLNGHTCFNCEKYYKMAMPNANDDDIKKMLNKCSRHRARDDSVLNETIAGYWKPYLTNTECFASGDDND